MNPPFGNGRRDADADRGFVHDAFVYRSDDELLSVLVPFLREAHEHGDAAVADVGDRTTTLLRRELGAHAHDVEFLEGRWYTNPASALREYARCFESLAADHGLVRSVVELPPVATNGSWHAWRRYEAVMNVAFEGLPAWKICLFEAATIPPEVITDALCTHPRLTTPPGPPVANERYTDPAEWLRQLPSPPISDLERTSPLVHLVDPVPQQARAAIAPLADSLPVRDRDGLIVGVSEIVSNGIAHGEPPVTVRAWAGEGSVIVTVDDCGPGVDDPFAGLLAPRRERDVGGLGLWIAHQVCADVALINHAEGFRVRIVAGSSMLSP